MNNIDSALKDGKKIAEQLLNEEPLHFGNLKPSDIPNEIAGIYAIFDENTEETLYVGRSKNLKKRLYTQHLHGKENTARLKKYLVEDKLQKCIKNMADAKQYLKDNCYVKYIIENDTVQRGRIEGLLSYLLAVRYIHEEH